LSWLRLLIAGRTEEYRAATAEVGVLPQALVLDVLPIDRDDAIAYLSEREALATSRWADVDMALRSDPDGPLAHALSTPLMISLAREVYSRPATSPAELVELDSEQAVHRRLLDRFLPAIYGSAPAAERARRWLALLARYLPDHPGDPNLAWWRLGRAVSRPFMTAVMVALGAGTGAVLSGFYTVNLYSNGDWHSFIVDDTRFLAWAVLTGAGFGGVLGLIAGMHAARAARADDRSLRRLAWLRAMLGGMLDIAIAAAVLAGLVAAMLLCGHAWRPASVEPIVVAIDDLFLSPQLWRDSIVLALILITAALLFTYGLGAGGQGGPRRSNPHLRGLVPRLLVGLGLAALIAAVWLATQWTFNNGSWQGPDLLLAGFVFTLLLGMPRGLGRWLSSPAAGTEAVSVRSSLRGDRTALLAVVLGAALSVFVVSLAVLYKPSISGQGPGEATVAGMASAGRLAAGWGAPWTSYTIVRVWLSLTRRLPWRLMGALRDAHRRGVVRQTGSMYQFRHDIVQAHLTR
jgi:hypothetical protein